MIEQMTIPSPSPRDLRPPNRIRVETAFSRFPIHCLSKRGGTPIDLHRIGDDGVADFRWEVTYTAKYGQPGPLAYKVDTLVVNRLLDQIGRPLPELIRIGSLSDVCRSLGTKDTGPNIANLKSAFLQNASAFINAKVRYKTKTGREKWAEIGYSRYSVIFTGEPLPDGTQADAVHIVLNPPYRELLNHVETRPLDYDYLKKLAPGPQRFYELLSFQIYGAIAGNRPRAKMLYSDYCKYAPQVRYGDFDHVKKQMFKLHSPHRESGYIKGISYEQTTDGEGKADWEVYYTPGPKAFAEFEAFTNRRAMYPALAEPAPSVQQPRRLPAQASLNLTEQRPELLAELTQRGISEKKARELLLNLKPGQEVMEQLEYVDSLVEKDRRGQLENPPGLYVFYIRDNVPVPRTFPSSKKTRLQHEAQQRRDEEVARHARLELEYDDYRTAQIDRYIETMPQLHYQRLHADQKRLVRTMFKALTPAQIEETTGRAVRSEIANSGALELMTLDEFIASKQD